MDMRANEQKIFDYIQQTTEITRKLHDPEQKLTLRKRNVMLNKWIGAMHNLSDLDHAKAEKQALHVLDHDITDMTVPIDHNLRQSAATLLRNWDKQKLTTTVSGKDHVTGNNNGHFNPHFIKFT